MAPQPALKETEHAPLEYRELMDFCCQMLALEPIYLLRLGGLLVAGRLTPYAHEEAGMGSDFERRVPSYCAEFLKTMEPDDQRVLGHQLVALAEYVETDDPIKSVLRRNLQGAVEEILAVAWHKRNAA